MRERGAEEGFTKLSAAGGEGLSAARGAPSLSGETGERYQLTKFPPTVADKLGGLGADHYQADIIKAAVKLKGEVMKKYGRS